MQILRGLTGGSTASAGLGKLQIIAAAIVLRLVLAPQLTSIVLERMSHGSQVVPTCDVQYRGHGQSWQTTINGLGQCSQFPIVKPLTNYF